MKPYDAVPFTNEFGQVINPGDSCVVVAKGYSGGISTYKGRYLGVRTYTTYYRKNDPQYQVVAEVEETYHCRVGPDGQELEWNDPGYRDAPMEQRIKKRITNLWLNLIYPSTFA